MRDPQYLEGLDLRLTLKPAAQASTQGTEGTPAIPGPVDTYGQGLGALMGLHMAWAHASEEP